MTKPLSFVEAIQDRYGSEDKTEYDQSAFLVGFGGKNAKVNKKWEMVGMEKTRKQQSNHSRLQTLVLKDAMITVPEKEEGEIKNAQLVRATEVDLSGNFDLTVDHIKAIVEAVPNLQLLQINRIPLLLTNEERVGMADKLLAEGRIEYVTKVGAVSSPTTGGDDKSALTAPTELVAKVLPDLPLCFLNVDLATTSTPLPQRLLTATWPKLKQLVLNGTGLTSLMPLRGLTLASCEELHLDMNNITELFPASDSASDSGNSEALLAQFSGLTSVKIVSLALNRFEDWHGSSGLHRIATDAFPQITSLLVGGNRLPDFPLKELVATADSINNGTPIASLRSLLGRLTTLEISDNKRMDNHVTTLGAIRAFGSTIQTLRVSYDTLFADKRQFPTEAIARNLTIASLPALVTLNRAAVRPKERVDAELHYVQRCMSEFPELRQQTFESTNAITITGLDEATVATLAAKVSEAYPRYFDLRQQFKHVILSQTQGSSSAADGGNGFMVDVTIRADAFADQNKKLPAAITVQKVKALAAALFSGLDMLQMEVSFWTGGGSGGDNSVAVPIVLENDMQTLGFYGVPNGSIIKIRDLKDKRSK